jgi:CheY-like chemotaxis protein
MRTRDPYDRPLRITVIGDELVFLGEGPVNFAMTREAAALTLENLIKALAGLPEPTAVHAPEPARGVILLVEDEPLVREVTVAVLEEAGYAVIPADGPRQALLALEARGEIHLLFTDVQMPGEIDGLELAHLVRRRWPRVRLLVTSGQYPVAAEELPAGGRFLSKPYVAADVLRQVDELLAA